ncbi:hypothetical protein EKE94_13725 [Mesobaculum littorinae]|uniref:Fe/B12 periplasmic-binding domain-containing protein n=1 Tax=Mesobaculum littorinae TaxID=2486419 RepID=A0A438AFV6_9RHOB|nr:ABC transporter substrate-binding protein [Mesobaculum littorinae]RVV97586.1 hypothetical protein EKE94_13725 [Mesobaculum littorinae]
MPHTAPRAPIRAAVFAATLAVVVTFALAGFAAGARAEVIDITDIPAYPDLYGPESAPEAPRDLVLLDAELVEIAVALGAADRILARPAAIDLPGIEETPYKVRDWAGVEGIVGMRPGKVLTANVRFDTLRAGLERVGIDTDIVNRTRPATEKVALMAGHLGLEDRGAALIAQMRQSYADAAAESGVGAGGAPLRILHASKQGAGGNFSAGGAGTGVHNLIERVGAVNAAAEVGMDRYRSVTPEGVLMMAPDVILISESELEAFGGVDGIWEGYPGLAQTPAGRGARAIVMQDLHVRADAASSGLATRALAGALAEMFP